MGEFEKSCVNCGVLNCAKRDKEYRGVLSDYKF